MFLATERVHGVQPVTVSTFSQRNQCEHPARACYIPCLNVVQNVLFPHDLGARNTSCAADCVTCVCSALGSCWLLVREVLGSHNARQREPLHPPSALKLYYGYEVVTDVRNTFRHDHYVRSQTRRNSLNREVGSTPTKPRLYLINDEKDTLPVAYLA